MFRDYNKRALNFIRLWDSPTIYENIWIFGIEMVVEKV